MSYLWITPFEREHHHRPTTMEWPFSHDLLSLANVMDVDRSLESMDNEMKRLRRTVEKNAIHNPLQLINQIQRPGSIAEHRSMMNPVVTDEKGNRQLRLKFDVRNFKPEEVEVTLDSSKRSVIVEAKHEETDKETNHSVKRHYWRSYYLPESVVDDVSKLELKSTMEKGNLTIESALPALPPPKPEENNKQSDLACLEPREIKVKKI